MNIDLRFASFWKEADKTEIFCTSFRLFRQSFCFIRLTSEWFKKKPNNNLSQQHTSYISLTTYNLQLTTYNSQLTTHHLPLTTYHLRKG